MTLLPRQFTIFVVIRLDLARTVELACAWLFAGCAEVMLIVNDGQRSAREAIVMVPKSMSELLLLLLML